MKLIKAYVQVAITDEVIDAQETASSLFLPRICDSFPDWEARENAINK